MLEKSALQFIDRHNLIPDKARLLVGVSGGPDSLALLHFLGNIQKERELFIVVAHFDHMFRGQQSYEDLLFVEEFCRKNDFEIITERFDVPKYIKQTKKSKQVAARECRYLFFEKVMREHALDFLALGHHGDDQVETVLMRLTRGSTGTARAGIPFERNFSRGKIIRPFLGSSREEIESYCFRKKLTPRLDPSNEEDDYVRNRLRRVLPALKKENPRVHEQFQRFSEELTADEDYLQKRTKEKLDGLLQKDKQGEIRLEIAPFLTMPNPLQRRGIQLILKYLYEAKLPSLSATHIDEVLALMKKDHPSGELHFPLGLHVVRSYEICSFQRQEEEEVTKYRVELGEQGSVTLPNGSKITLQYKAIRPQFLPTSNFVTVFDPYEVTLPIVVRVREAGDKINPKGMTGSKKLSRIFIEEKISLAKRESWPVVTNNEGEVIWLPGLKKSHLDRSDQRLTEYLMLNYEEPSGKDGFR